jgi:glycosyltransferase involved in cell wall biosynthesis
MSKLTVIILTLNEETNLAAALDSVQGWAEEIFVVDSFSTDRTVDLALSRAAAGVRVVQHRFENYAAQWNWALEKLPIRTEWILKLDADERVPAEFKAEFERVLADPRNPQVAYYFRRRIVFLGRPLQWGVSGANWDVRIWKHAYARFENRCVNEHLLPRGGPVGRLQTMVEHYDYKDLTAWIEKQNRYSAMEALIRIRGEDPSTIRRLFGSKTERSNWLRNLFYRLPFRHLLYFLLGAVVRGGFLDGLRGLHYALLRTLNFYFIDLKVQEHRLTGKLPQVPKRVLGSPHPQVVNSDLQKFMDTRPDFNPLAPGVHFPWIEQQRLAATS